jgi:hypothetical protein
VGGLRRRGGGAIPRPRAKEPGANASQNCYSWQCTSLGHHDTFREPSETLFESLPGWVTTSLSATPRSFALHLTRRDLAIVE